MEELLPIGSKVMLNNGTKLFIIGYLPSKPNDEKIYDYICARNKKGIIRKKDDLVLNKDYFYICENDIKYVLFMGFQDEEFLTLNKVYPNLIDEVKKARCAEPYLDEETLDKIYEIAVSNAIRELGE